MTSLIETAEAAPAPGLYGIPSLGLVSDEAWRVAIGTDPDVRSAIALAGTVLREDADIDDLARTIHASTIAREQRDAAEVDWAGFFASDPRLAGEKVQALVDRHSQDGETNRRLTPEALRLAGEIAASVVGLSDAETIERIDELDALSEHDSVIARGIKYVGSGYERYRAWAEDLTLDEINEMNADTQVASETGQLTLLRQIYQNRQTHPPVAFEGDGEDEKAGAANYALSKARQDIARAVFRAEYEKQHPDASPFELMISNDFAQGAELAGRVVLSYLHCQLYDVRP